MALYVTRPRRDEERIGRGLPSVNKPFIYSNSNQLCFMPTKFPFIETHASFNRVTVCGTVKAFGGPGNQARPSIYCEMM